MVQNSVYEIPVKPLLVGVELSICETVQSDSFYKISRLLNKLMNPEDIRSTQCYFVDIILGLNSIGWMARRMNQPGEPGNN